MPFTLTAPEASAETAQPTKRVLVDPSQSARQPGGFRLEPPAAIQPVQPTEPAMPDNWRELVVETGGDRKITPENPQDTSWSNIVKTEFQNLPKRFENAYLGVYASALNNLHDPDGINKWLNPFKGYQAEARQFTRELRKNPDNEAMRAYAQQLGIDPDRLLSGEWRDQLLEANKVTQAFRARGVAKDQRLQSVLEQTAANTDAIAENSVDLPTWSAKGLSRDVLVGVQEMAPAVLAGLLTRGRKVGVQTGAGIMGTQAYSHSYLDGLQSMELPHELAAERAAIFALAEFASEAIPLKTILSDTKRLNKILQASYEEGVQEGVTEILQQGYDFLRLDEDITFNEFLEGIAHSFVVGAGVGGSLAAITPGAAPASQKADDPAASTETADQTEPPPADKFTITPPEDAAVDVGDADINPETGEITGGRYSDTAYADIARDQMNRDQPAQGDMYETDAQRSARPQTEALNLSAQAGALPETRTRDEENLSGNDSHKVDAAGDQGQAITLPKGLSLSDHSDGVRFLVKVDQRPENFSQLSAIARKSNGRYSAADGMKAFVFVRKKDRDKFAQIAQGLDEQATAHAEASRKQQQLAVETEGEWSQFAPETKTLGIPRAEMPQIKAEHRGAMVNFLKGRGIQSEIQTVPASSLKPTQAEFSPAKVKQASEYEGGDRSILTSSDNYVVDGHHQWLAKQGSDIQVIRINAPIKKLLKTVSEFPSAEVSTETAKPAIRDQWEIPKAEWVDGQKRTAAKHREIIKKAIDEGQTVPAEVLKGYPTLKKYAAEVEADRNLAPRELAAKKRAARLAELREVDVVDRSSVERTEMMKLIGYEDVEAAGFDTTKMTESEVLAKSSEIIEKRFGKKDSAPSSDGPVLQNRDRASQASITQMLNIASKPDYSQAGISRLITDGAPVVSFPEVTLHKQYLGREDTATTAQGRRIPIQYAVVEADQLLASHNADGTRNAQYENETPGIGRAIGGNGRVAGLQRGHQQGTTQKYIDEMAADSAMHGISAEVIRGMKQPILVRIMPKEEITDNIADETNTRTTADLTPAEQAKTDARRINVDGITLSEDGEITRKSAEEFIAAMPQSEQSGLLDKGQPNRQAYDRLNNLIFRHAFDSDVLLRLQAEAVDPEVRTIMSALRIVAPKLARLRGTGDYDIRGMVEEAAEAAVNARRSNESLETYANQLDMERNPEIEPILRLMAENIRSAKRIAEGLTNYADLFYNESQRADVDMFGDVQKRSRAELMGDIHGNQSEPTNPEDSGDARGQAPADRSAERETSEQESAANTEADRTETGQEVTSPKDETPPGQAVAPQTSELAEVTGALKELTATLKQQAEKKPTPEATPAESVSFVESTEKFMDRMREGGVTVEELRTTYNNFMDSWDDNFTELSKRTKQQLLDAMPMSWRYKNDKKDAVVRAYMSDLQTDFIAASDRTLSFTMGGGDYKASHDAAVQAIVDSVTQEQLDTFAQKVAESRKAHAEKIAESEKGIENPQTLDDYRNLLTKFSRDTGEKNFKKLRAMLPVDQRIEYDRLAALETRGKRDFSQNAQKTRLQTSSQNVSGSIIETKHTKKGHDLFVVQLSDRVSKDDYTALNSSAKKLGGYYSSYRGGGAIPGFTFTERENADAFMKLAGGDTEQAQGLAQARRDSFQDDRSQSAVERLREMAAAMEERGTEALNQDRKVNTSRRVSMAARAEAVAQASIAMAKTMSNIAAAIESGTVVFLDQVRTKAQVEMIDSFLHTAKYTEARERFPDNPSKAEDLRNSKPTGETVDYAEFPAYSAWRSDLARLGRQLQEIAGAKRLGDRLLKVADDVTDQYTKWAKDNLHLVSRFSRSDGQAPVLGTKELAMRSISQSGFRGQAAPIQVKRGQWMIVLSPAEAQKQGVWAGQEDTRVNLSAEFAEELVTKLNRKSVDIPWVLEAAHDKRKRLSSMNIETPAEFRSMLQEYIGLQEQQKAPDKIKELERSMVGRRNDGLDFFPTPAPLVDEMIEAADISEGQSILEPSAGMGHIADQLRSAGFEPDVIELSGDRRELLEAKGYKLVANNFTDFDGQYDRIIMNPPFSERRDAEHVQHAYSLLKPGGRLVAIVGEGIFFGSDKKAQAFRDWFESVNGSEEKLAEHTFMDSSLPVNTGVSARMIVIEKQNDVTPVFSRAPQTNTEAFKNWFGDSKVVDAVGNPLVVYHGAPDARFATEDGVFKSVNDRFSMSNATGERAFWFAKDRTVAGTYADDRRAFDYQNADAGVIPAYLSLQNPLIINGKGKTWREVQQRGKTSDVIEQARNSGNDGVIIKNVIDDYSSFEGNRTGKITDTYVVFSSNQIKSTANSGTFDPNNPDIRMSRGTKTVSIPIADAKALVNGITSRLNNAPEVIVLQSMQDDQVPEAVRREDARQRSQGAKGDPEGFYYGGKAYIVLDGLSPLENETAAQALFRVFAHEILGHRGLRGFFRGGLNNVLAEVAAKRSEDVQRKATEYGLNIKKRADRLTAAEEVLAEMAQREPENSLVTRAVEAVRRALRLMFSRLPPNIRKSLEGRKFVKWINGMTDAEMIDRFIVPARNFVRNGAVTKGSEAAPAFHRAGEKKWYRSELQRNIGLLTQIANKQGMIGKEQAKRWIDAAAKKGLFKAEEVEWTGLKEWLVLADGKVSVDSIQAFVDANGVQVEETQFAITEEDIEALLDDELGEGMTREDAIEYLGSESSAPQYADRTLPGGENYREALLTLPETEMETLMDVAARLYGKKYQQLSTDERKKVLDESGRSIDRYLAKESRENFISAHWLDSNVLAHIRMDDRTDAQGNRVLFVQEIQSDWGQQGRKDGFKSEVTAALSRKYPTLNADRSMWSINELKDAGVTQPEIDAWWSDSMQSRVPRAPFVTKTEGWLNLALKRVMALAVEDGYDKVAFVTGEQAADFFDLSKQVDSITWRSADIDGYILHVTDYMGKVETVRVESDAELESTIGKELASRVVSEVESGAASGLYKGLDLKVGGEGMKVFYDQIVPASLKNVVKKLGGGQVEAIDLKLTDMPWSEYEKYAVEHPYRQKNAPRVSGITITEAMREKVSEGIPLFSRNQSEFSLETQTEEELSAQDLQKKNAAKKAQQDALEQEQRDQADREVDDFTLSGSDSVADKAAARGQQSLFSRSKPAGQTNTPEFKRWFGDSKVVDKSGEPVVMYHGQPRPEGDAIDSFDDRSHLGDGTYFTNNASYAENYGVEFRAEDPSPDFNDTDPTGPVYPVYLSIKNPLKLSGENARHRERYIDRGYDTRELEKQGYDGVLLRYKDGEIEAMAFRPEQIKSAIGNQGTFDPSNPDIRFSRPSWDEQQRASPAKHKDVATDIAKSIKGARTASMLEKAGWKLQDYRANGLYFLARNHLVEIGSKVLPTMNLYLAQAKRMDAFRNHLLAERSVDADAWRKYAQDNKKEAQQLSDLMHDATIAGVDPATDYAPITDYATVKANIKKFRQHARERSGEGTAKWMDLIKKENDKLNQERNRKEQSGELYERWKKLSPEAKQIYITVRDAYSDHQTEVLNALEQRIEENIASEKHRRALIDALRAQFENSRVQAPYFPLSRFGEYWARVQEVDREDYSFHMFETKGDQTQFLRSLAGDKSVKVSHGKKLENFKDLNSVSAGFVADVQLILNQAGSGPTMQKIKDEIYQLYLTSLPDLSVRKHFIHRGKIKGYSQDAIRSFSHFMFHGSYQLARLKYAHKLENLLEEMRSDISIAGNEKATTELAALGTSGEPGVAQRLFDIKAIESDPDSATDFLNELQKRHEWAMNPKGSATAQFLTSFGFMFYLGISPAAAMVNLTQTPMVALPVMGAKWGYGISAKALTRATFDFFRGRRQEGGSFTVSNVLNEEESAAFKALEESGILDKTLGHDLAGMSEQGFEYNSTAHRVMNVVSYLFHHAERFNREITSLATYRLARSAGDSPLKAVQAAGDVTETSHFDYSSSNKARLLHSDTARVLLLFRQFSLNMTYLLARSTHQAFKADTRAARKEARMRMAGILGMTFTFSGITGLPLFWVVKFVLETMFDDEDEPFVFDAEFRKFLVDMTGSQTAGAVLARGPVDMATGASISTRVSLNNLWIREDNRDLEGQAAYQYWLEQVAGPIGGTAAGAFRWAQLMDEGRYGRAFESLLPVFARNALKAHRFNEEGANSMRGDALVADMPPKEVVLQLLGFMPTMLSERYEENSAVKRVEQRILDRRSRLLDRYALTSRLGDEEAVKETLEQIGRFNRANPEVGIRNSTIIQSMRSRRNYSNRANNGIILNPDLMYLGEKYDFAK